MASGRPNRRSGPPPPEASRRALRWALLAAAAVLVVGLGVVALIRLADDGDAALEVGDWSLSRGELRDDLEAVEDNAVYRTLRDQAGSPIQVREADGDAFTPAFVAEVVNDRLAFRLAEVALDERGGEVTAADREAARVRLAELLAGSAQLAGGQDATVEAVLDGFGGYRPVIEEGLAQVAALRRVVEADLPADAGVPSEGAGEDAEPASDEGAPAEPTDPVGEADGTAPDADESAGPPEGTDGADAAATGDEDAAATADDGAAPAPDEGAAPAPDEGAPGEPTDPVGEADGAALGGDAESTQPGSTPTDPEAERQAAVDAAVREVLIATAEAEGVVVAPDLGVYDPATATIGPAGPATAGLEPVEEGGADGTAVPGEGLSGEGTINPDGSIDLGPNAPDLGTDDTSADEGGAGADGSPSTSATDPDSIVGPPSAEPDDGSP